MKTVTTEQFKGGIAKVVSFIASDAHLVLQSMADGVVKAEASAVSKLTDVSYIDVAMNRNKATQETQDDIKVGIGFIGASVSKMFKSAGKLTKMEPFMTFEEHQVIVPQPGDNA